MKHMISQIRPGSTNESLSWHNYKKMLYFDSFVLQNLICTAYYFLPQSALYNFSDFLYFCVGFESVSKIL